MAALDVESPLHIRLFGPFDVRVQGEPLSPLRSRKGQWLLALLTLRHDREVAREWLAGTLWPDSDESQGLSSLRRTLTDLRHALNNQGERLCNPTAHTLCLNLAGVRADVADFDAAILDGSESALKRAVGLYRGPLLEGCMEGWILQEREERAQACLNALERLSELAMGKKEPEEALRYLRLALNIDPLRETAQRELMRALAESGSIAAATLAYRDFRLRLYRELNADPDPQTTRLFQHLRQSAQTAAKQISSAPSAISPEPSESLRSNLPTPLSSFIGREEDLRRVCALLLTSRLLTLVGAGGCGKTRLALQFAREAEHEEEGRPCWIELAALREPALAWGALAAALGIPEEVGRPLRETVCRALRARPRLLILDNCEHLLEIAGEMALTLLSHCPHIRILATSREPLRIEGEVTWRVASLSLPEPTLTSHSQSPQYRQSLPELMQYEAVRLFVERAFAATPRFELTERNSHSVAQLCRRLDGIPLAIELAATRVGALTPAQIEVRLEDRFRLLKWDRRDVLPRQKTLHALIDWSYDLLTEAEQILLRRLSVFAGGWKLEAAEAVCADHRGEGAEGVEGIESWEVLELLVRLVDKSLVIFDGEPGEGRYRLLETIREYALKPLRALGEEQAIQRRHYAYFLSLTGKTQEWKAGDVTATWLDTIEREYDNFRIALQNAVSPAHLQELASNLFWFWNIRGYWREGNHWLEQALQVATMQDEMRAKILNQTGILAWRHGNYAQAKKCLQESAAIYQDNGSQASTASALGNLGLVLCDMGDYAAARICHEKSLALARELRILPSIAAHLSNVGLVTMYEGGYAESRQFLTEAIALYRDLGNKRGLAITLGNLGLVALREEDYPAARAYNEESIALCRELAFKNMLAAGLHGLALTYSQWNDYGKARSCYRESLEIRRDIADLKGISDSLSCMGDLLLLHGNSRKAAVLVGAAERLRQEIGAALSPAEQQDCEATAQIFEEKLGKAEFQRAFYTGRELTLEEAIDLALQEEPDIPT